MTRASDNAFPSILITEGTEPSAPAAGKQRLYIDSTTHKLKRTDSSGTDVTIEASGNAVAGDTIWDAKGDLAAATGADAAAKVTVGSNDTILTADSAQSTGLVWAAPPQAASYKRSSGDYTTTSTTFVDVDGTNMALTITTRARRVLIGFVGSWLCSSAATLAMDFTVDGTRQGGDYGLAVWNMNHLGNAAPICPTYLTSALSAGSHTFKVQWKTSGGTATIEGAATGGSFAQFYVVEQGS